MRLIPLAVFLVVSVIYSTSPKIDGFFIQPSLGYGGIDYDASTFGSQQHFDDWVQSMADVGAEMLFYQWTAHYWGNQSWYTSTYNTPENAAYSYYDIADTTIDGITTQSWVKPTTWTGGDVQPIDRALESCNKSGIKLWLGLYLNEDSQSYNWWDAVSNSTIDHNDSLIIKHHIYMANFLVDDLYEKFGSHPAFGGFYYPVEVANLCFYPESNWDELAWLLDAVADRVHENNPNVKLAISPFFNSDGSIGGNGLSTAEELGAMWNYALANSDLDILMLQDGVGVDPHALTDTSDLISPYYLAVQNACQKNGVSFWANSELFTNKGTRTNPKFYSSNISKIEKQLKAENQLAEKSVCFSFQYIDPNPLHKFSAGTFMADSVDGPAERLRLYNEYKDYIDTLSTVETTNNKLTNINHNRISITKNALIISSNISESFEVKIFNISGREILSTSANNKLTFNTSKFSKGAYIIKMELQGFKTIRNFILD